MGSRKGISGIIKNINEMVAIGAFLFVFSIIIHEMGHASAMRKYGVELAEICLLGVAGPVLFSFTLKKVFGETLISSIFHPGSSKGSNFYETQDTF